jgi:hypothetical protein
MQEIRRQEYLQAIGIEAYIPRWKIPFAAESHLCDQSFEWSNHTKADVAIIEPIQVDNPNYQQDQLPPAIDLHQVLNSVVEKTQVKNNPSRIGDILQQIEDKKSLQIQSFSLSVWRPAAGFLIVAARNVNAMPTELLLNNFLRFYLQQSQLVLSEEVLRWPTIENSKMALNEKDACAELQTWLSVQHEFQSIKTLWFFGDIYRYFISEFSTSNDRSLIESCDIKLDQAKSTQTIRAKLLPDLSQFLLQPQLKEKLLSLV